jgi:hypothetical protein
VDCRVVRRHYRVRFIAQELRVQVRVCLLKCGRSLDSITVSDIAALLNEFLAKHLSTAPAAIKSPAVRKAAAMT